MKKAVLFLAAAVFALALERGETFGFTHFSDQFGADLNITAQTKLLYIAFDKKTGKALQAKLSKDLLQEQNALAIYELSRAPSMVLKLFMLPSFKKLPFSVAINRDKDVAAALPKQDGKITIIKLDGFKVQEISFKVF